MAKVGAQRAAELTGVSKSTIQRAMKAGKLSFEMDKNQRRLIDVSELERVFGLKPQENTVTTVAASVTQPDNSAMLELEKARHALEVEKLRMELRMAQEQYENAVNQIDDLKVQRDLWQKQAQQILITSQYSQKQSEERISEFREREEARQRIVEQRRNAGVVQHTGARPTQSPPQGTQGSRPQTIQAQTSAKTAQTTGESATQTVPPSRVAPAQNTRPPVFRTVQTSNQNTTKEKQSLFASLFGAKKKTSA